MDTFGVPLSTNASDQLAFDEFWDELLRETPSSSTSSSGSSSSYGFDNTYNPSNSTSCGSSYENFWPTLVQHNLENLNNSHVDTVPLDQLEASGYVLKCSMLH